MKKSYLFWFVILSPLYVYANADVTSDDLINLGLALLFTIGFWIIIPALIIACIAAGIRTIRGFFNF